MASDVTGQEMTFQKIYIYKLYNLALPVHSTHFHKWKYWLQNSF